jgi:GPH family glycoside/pentoside/hexuronide:cation symporter
MTSNSQADFHAAHRADAACRASERAIKLGLGTKLAYSTGAAAESMISVTLNTFLLFYVTAVCGLSGALAGAALAVGLVVDAVAEPIIGSISDGLQSRLGRRLPMMIVGLPIMVISFVLIFSLPSGLGQTELFLLLAALSTLLRISLSLFNLPYLALGAELSEDYAERSKIAIWRWGIGVSGALVGLAVGFSVFFKGTDGLAQRTAYRPFAMTLAVAIVVLALIAMRAVFATRNRHHAAPVSTRGLIRRLATEVMEVLRNRSFRLLFLSALFFFIAQGVTGTLGLHANTYFWQLTAGQVQLVTMSFVLGLLLGAPIAGSVLALMEKRTALVASLGAFIVTQGGPATLRLLGLFPIDGQTLAVTLAITTALGGALMSVAAVAFMSMMADAADEHELLFGARREGLYFAGWAFAGKAASGGGALISGLVLQAIAFPSNIASKGVLAVALPSSTTNWLGFFYGPGAAVLSLVGVMIMFWYPIDRRAHAAIMTALARRRAAHTELAK